VPLALAAFAIALAIAWVMHKLVEIPAQRWLLRYDRSRHASTHGVVAAR
jgi:peptidoglycan/LPS O-acetylase OafA/YrhL